MAKTKVRKCKGRIVEGYLKFVKKKWGSDGLNECIKASKYDLSNITEDRWYDVDYTDQVIWWIRDTHGMDAVRQSGFSTATNRGVVTFAARLMGIKRVMAQAEKEFRENFNYGDIKIKMMDSKARVIFTDVGPDETICHAWLGAFQGIMHITKTPGIVTKKACQHKGDKNCIYELKWS